jgi:hypothetical protein
VSTIDPQQAIVIVSFRAAPFAGQRYSLKAREKSLPEQMRRRQGGAMQSNAENRMIRKASHASRVRSWGFGSRDPKANSRMHQEKWKDERGDPDNERLQNCRMTQPSKATNGN